MSTSGNQQDPAKRPARRRPSSTSAAERDPAFRSRASRPARPVTRQPSATPPTVSSGSEPAPKAAAKPRNTLKEPTPAEAAPAAPPEKPPKKEKTKKAPRAKKITAPGSGNRAMWVVWGMLMLLLVGGGVTLGLFTDFFTVQPVAAANAEHLAAETAEAVEETPAEPGDVPAAPTDAEELSGPAVVEAAEDDAAPEATEEVVAEEPDAEPVVEATPTPEPTAEAAPAGTNGLSQSWIISMAATSQESNAQAAVANYQSQGFQQAGYYYIPDLEPNGKALYKVYVGPFPEKADAATQLAAVKNANPNAYLYFIK